MNPYDKYWKDKYDILAAKDLADWQKSYWWDYREIINQHKFLLRQLEGYIPGRSMVVDIGCGPGVSSRLLSSLGYQVVGLDFSWNTVKQAVKSSESHRNVYLQADANFLPWKGESFDIALALGIFQMASDTSREIKEAHRILKPGGKVIISTPIRYRVWELPFYPIYCLMTCDGFPDHQTLQVKMVKQRETVPPRPSDPQSDIIKRHPISFINKLLLEAGFKDIIVRYPGRITILPYLVNSVMVHISAVKK